MGRGCENRLEHVVKQQDFNAREHSKICYSSDVTTTTTTTATSDTTTMTTAMRSADRRALGRSGRRYRSGLSESQYWLSRENAGEMG